MGKTDSNKIGTMSRDVCEAIKNLSKKGCEELNKYSQKQCTEISNMSKEVCKAINQHAEPSKFDKWNMLFTVLGIFCSVGAIIVAIYIPNKIAKEQNKIALFDKRYDVYCEMLAMTEFMEEFHEECTDDTGVCIDREKFKQLWKDEIHMKLYSSVDDVETVLKLQGQKVKLIDFVFEEITEADSETLKNFFEVYYTLTRSAIIDPGEPMKIYKNEASFFSAINCISEVMKKMEKQLDLN